MSAAGLPACAATGAAAASQTAPAPETRLELPPALAAWRPELESALASLEAAFHDQAAARWPQHPALAPARLIVVEDSAAAAAWMQRLDHGGDPAVPRTYPAQRHAVIPLPQSDALLYERRRPPRTWLQSLLHEAVHLLSLDRPALREAPSWFQEGLAEHLALSCCRMAEEWSDRGLARRLLETQETPGELLADLAGLPAAPRLEAYAALSGLCLAAGAGAAPWSRASGLSRADFLAALPAVARSTPPVAGRDFDPPSPGSPMLLAAPPGRTVEVVLLDPWDGRSHLTFTVQAGRSGSGVHGLTLTAASGRRLHFRWNRYGSALAWQEDAAAPVPPPPLSSGWRGAGLGREITVEVELRGPRLHLSCPGYQASWPLPEGEFAPPFRAAVYVADGVLTVEL